MWHEDDGVFLIIKFAYIWEIETFLLLYDLVLKEFGEGCPTFIDITEEFFFVAEESVFIGFAYFGYLR